MPSGGSRPHTGGARAGAGRKSKATSDAQIAMRAVVADCVTADKWRTVAQRALSDAQAGDEKARAWLTSWVMGKVPDQLEVEARTEMVVRIVRDRGSLAASAHAARDAAAGAG